MPIFGCASDDQYSREIEDIESRSDSIDEVEKCISELDDMFFGCLCEDN